MNEPSGILVFWILGPLFLAVGLYLIWFNHRREKMLENFAKENQLHLRPEFEQEVQKKLDNAFSLKTEGLVRRFGQLSSIIDGGPVLIFRSVEVLDLNPYGRSSSTHFSRIVALFDIPMDFQDAFFLMDTSLQTSNRLPGSRQPDPEALRILKETAPYCRARHSLSVTFSRGHGLIYFEPLVTGGETIADIHSLFCITQALCKQLSSENKALKSVD